MLKKKYDKYDKYRKEYNKHKEEYILHLKGKESSPHTIRAYEKIITDFFNSFPYMDSIEDFTSIDISRWLEIKKRLSPRTVALHMSIMRSFFNYLIKKDVISSNVFDVFVSPKAQKKIPTTVSVQEMLDLLQNMPRNTILERRNHCMLMMMYATGIRSEELCSLERNNVDLKQNTIKVKGKGKKERIIPIIPIMVSSISDWLVDRKQLDKKKSDALFLSNNSRSMTTSMIRTIVRQESQRNSQYIHPHAFRYTFATHLLDKEVNLRHIQDLLGHANLSTTQRYTKASISNLKQKFKQFHPRA